MEDNNGTKKVYTAIVNGKRVGCFISSKDGNDGWLINLEGVERSYTRVFQWSTDIRNIYDESLDIKLECVPE